MQAHRAQSIPMFVLRQNVRRKLRPHLPCESRAPERGTNQMQRMCRGLLIDQIFAETHAG